MPPTVTDIREAVVTELKTVPDLGGDEKKIRKWGFESDDEAKTREFWESTTDSIKRINAMMLTRKGFSSREIATGGRRIQRKMHRFELLFRLGGKQGAVEEEDFEALVELTINKIQSNDAIFKVNGKHPQPDAQQTVDGEFANIKIFHERAFQARLTFTVVEEITAL